MKKISNKLFLLSTTVCLAIGLFTGGCFADLNFGRRMPKTNRDLQILTIGTADSGGTMYPVGKAIAEVIAASDEQIVMNISAGSGSAANVQSLIDGEIDLGLVSGDVALAAVNGDHDFTGQPAEGLRAVAAVYSSLSNWMALDSSDAVWVHDLAGKQIGIGPEDSTTALSAYLALQVAGITSENSALLYCGLGSGAENVKNETLDAVHGFTGIPINSFSHLAETVPTRVLKYTETELEEIIRQSPSYYYDIIPANTYAGQTTDISTFGIKCLLCVSEAMDEDLVYELTSILYENSSELKNRHSAMAAMGRDRFMYEELPIELHAGAKRFYQEQGLIDLP